MQRTAVAEEISAAAVYLASDQATYTTGTDIIIDGGLITELHNFNLFFNRLRYQKT